jgi:hypothetical protein
MTSPPVSVPVRTPKKKKRRPLDRSVCQSWLMAVVLSLNCGARSHELPEQSQILAKAMELSIDPETSKATR